MKPGAPRVPPPLTHCHLTQMRMDHLQAEELRGKEVVSGFLGSDKGRLGCIIPATALGADLPGPSSCFPNIFESDKSAFPDAGSCFAGISLIVHNS